MANNKQIKKQIVQSTQQQLPIRDITNGAIITTDNRMVKVVEIKPIAFSSLKKSQQNMVRNYFENMLKTMPEQFQMKSVSVPANLSAQIDKMTFNISKEGNEECRKLGNEYRKRLIETQDNTVERKFYIAFSDNDLDKKLKDNTERNRAFYRINQIGNSIAARISECGNSGMSLGNNEIASLLYMLLNRNTCYKIPFSKRYEQVYQRYVNEIGDEQPYIPPVDYLAPDKIQYLDKNYLICDGRYYSFLYITNNGYPAEVWTGWLDIFVNSLEGVDVDVFVRRKDKTRYKNKLRQTIGHTKSDLANNYNETTDSYYNATNKFYSAEYLYSCLQSGMDIYDVSIIITVSSSTLVETNHMVEILTEEASSRDIKIRPLTYQQEQAFKSVLPLNKLDAVIENKAKRNMQQTAVSTLYPFTTFQLIDERGLYIADSLNSNSPILPNFWNTRFVRNPHIFICGQSGAGKTSAMELIAVHARVMGMPVFIIAPEKQDDYKRLCLALGGQYVAIGQGSADRINIMEIFENDANVEADKDLLYQSLNKKSSYLEARIGVVIEFIHTYYSEMSNVEKSYLNDALEITYKKKGITKDNESLWDETHTKYKEMPILEDLVEVLSTMGKETEGLYRAVRYLTTGVGSFFNGQTNVDVHNKFFVIGLENNTKETKSLSAYLAEDFCQMKIREDRTTHVLYVIDEGWAMLDNPATAAKMREDSKILRGFGCMMLFGTQQMADVLSTEQGQAIIKNSETRIIMQHKDEDIKYISQFLELSATEQKKIRSFSVGEALFIANENHIPIKFSPSDFEALLIFNDEQTLGRYADYIRSKKAREKDNSELAKRIEEALKISELTDNDSNAVKAIKSSDYIRLMSKEGVEIDG